MSSQSPTKKRNRTTSEDLSGLVGGYKRRRSGGGMKAMKRPISTVPDDAALSCGFRFPNDPATPTQEKRFQRIVKEYLKREIAYQHRDFGADAIAEALNVSESTAEKLLRYVREEKRVPVIELVKDVLLGMASGDIAGVLGTRKTKTSSAIFAMIHYNERTIQFETAADQDWYQRAAAAFRIDYAEWRFRS